MARDSWLVAFFGCVCACTSLGGSPEWARGAVPRCPIASTDTALQPGQLEVVGALSPQRVEAALSERMEDMQSCYQAGLHVDGNSDGTVTFLLTVGPQGAVEETCVQAQTTPDDATVRCMLQELRSARFEAAADSSRVRLSLQLILYTAPDGAYGFY